MDTRIALMAEHGVRIPAGMSDAVALEAWEAFVEKHGIPGWNYLQQWLDRYPKDGMAPPAPPRPDELDVPHWAVGVIQGYRQELELPERVTDRMIFARAVEAGRLNPGNNAILVIALASLPDEVPE